MYKFIYTDHQKNKIVFETIAPDILIADKQINETLGIDVSKCGWIGCQIIKESVNAKEISS